MNREGDAPKNEFSNFLEDISEEISQRVESLKPPPRPAGKKNRELTEEHRVLDWPSVADRIIDEMR
jgi:hypothetical protein